VIEVELKARLVDPAAVEKRLREFASFVRDFEKRDSYWHGPDWRINRGTKGFRLRTDGARTTVTFKNKRSEGGIEINHEREFSVSDLPTFDEFLERLGCEPFYEKRKRGKRFEVDPGSGAPIALELAEVEGLGWFLEIEALVPEDDPAAVALAQGEIRALLAKTGLEETAIEGRYYSELLIAAGLVAVP